MTAFSDPRHLDGGATWHHQLVAGVVAAYVDCVYIEVGVLTGGCWMVAAPHAAEAHGVDEDVRCEGYMGGIGTFWHMRSDKFFKQYDGSPPDVIFVDGCHNDPIVSRDVRNALALLAPRGTLVMHDTQPVIWGSGERPDRPDLEGRLPAPGDGYGIVERFRADAGIECITFQRFPGLTLARRV